MGDGAISNQNLQVYAQAVAAMMAQQDGPVTAPAQQQAPAMPADSQTQPPPQGAAAPSIPLGAAELQPPPELGIAQNGQLVVKSSEAAYLGMDIRVQGQFDPAQQIFIPNEPYVFTNATGQVIDLAALEAQQGIGYSDAAPAPGAAGGPEQVAAPGPDEPVTGVGQPNAQGFPKITYPDGRPWAGKDLYHDVANDKIVDANGATVDPQTVGLGSAAPSGEETTMVKAMKAGTTIAGGAVGAGFNYLWYRSASVQGMTSKIASLKKSSAAFKAGTSISGKLKNTPVVGKYVNWRQSSRVDKIADKSRSVKVLGMTSAQEGRLLAQEKLAALKASSKGYRNGTSLMGKMANKPVIGTVVKPIGNALDARRQTAIKTVTANLKAKKTPIGTWNRVKGGIMPTIMLANDAHSIYTGVKHWNDPGNDRKYDDALRIGGNAVSAAGDVMLYKKGNLKAALITNTVGLLVSTVGGLLDDRD